MDAVLEPFRTGIGLRALAEVVLLGLVCGPLGAWIVLHRQSFAAESMSHGMLPGLVLAALAGVPVVLGAAGGVLVAALAIAAAGRDERLGADAGVAVAVTALVGAGSVLALAPRAPARLEELLFGDPLGVTGRDLLVAALLVAVAAAGLALSHRRLVAAAFDPVASASLGARPDRAQLLLLVLIAGVIAVSAQALGNLLAVALILGPGAAGVAAGRRLPAVLGIATAGAVAAGIAGLELSFHASVATGAAIALCAVAVAVMGAALPRAVISRR
jgi:ABC-type Mn2+/Zn2+ transport system permease subunit